MNKLLIESVIIGIITSIIGHIIIKILVKFNKIDDNESLDDFINKYNKTFIIEISLFFTGILLHLLLEYIGLNDWYCEKKCIKDRCQIVCTKNL